MSQKQQYRRVEKGELQTQYTNRKPGGSSRVNSAPQPKYQWVVSAAEGRRRGGSSDRGRLPPSHPNSSIKRSFKKSIGQGEHSKGTGATAKTKFSVVQNAPINKSELSGSSDVSSSKAPVKRTLQYRKKDGQIVPRSTSSRSLSEPSDSSTSKTSLRGNYSSEVSFRSGNVSPGCVHKKQAHQISSKRERIPSTSPMSSKQQAEEDVKPSKGGTSELQPRKDVNQSKNGNLHLRNKAKNYVASDHNSSKPGATTLTFSISSKQCSKLDGEMSKNEIPSLLPKVKHQKPENESPYFRPRPKRYSCVQWCLSKAGATAPASSISSEQLSKREVEPPKDETRHLQSKEFPLQSKHGNSHPKLRNKRYVPMCHNSSRSEASASSSSISGKQKQQEEVVQSRNETPNFPTKTQTKIPEKVVSATSVVTSTQDVSRPTPGVSVATLSCQQSQQSSTPLELGIPRPEISTQAMMSKSLQIPSRLRIGNCNQVQQLAFVLRPQSFPLQPQEMMNYNDRFNIPPHGSYQLGSPFGSFSRSPPQYVHNHVRKFSSHEPVKITHPQTNEELRLDKLANMKMDGGSSAPRPQRNVGLQPLPVAYAPSYSMNYFPHMWPNPFCLQNPTSVPFTSTQILPKSSNLGICSRDFPSNSGHASSVSVLMSSKRPATYSGEMIFSRMITRSTVNQTNDAAKTLIVGSEQLPQAETSRFPENSEVQSCQAGDCHNSTSASLKEVQPPDSILKPPMSLEHNISGSVKLEMINLEAASSSTDRCESSLVSASLPDAQAGFSFASVEPCSATINYRSKIDIKDAGHGHNGPADIQTDQDSEKLFEQQGTNLFEQPFGHKIYGDKNMSNLRVSECNDQNRRDSILRTGKNASHGSLTTLNSKTGKTGNNLGCHKYSLSHRTGSIFEPPGLDSFLECDGIKSLRRETLESRTESRDVKKLSLSDSGSEIKNVYVPSAILSNDNILELRRIQEATYKGKRNRKEILIEAGAATTTSDLCIVPKDRKEEQKFPKFLDIRDNRLTIRDRRISSCSSKKDFGAKVDVKDKCKAQDWEGIDKLSSLELHTPNKVRKHQNLRHATVDGSRGKGKKKYSRYFLLSFSWQFTKLPANFHLADGIEEGLIIDFEASTSHGIDHNLHRNFSQDINQYDRLSHLDRHHSRMEVDNRWTKSPAHVASKVDQHFRSTRGTNGSDTGRGGTYSSSLHKLKLGQYSRCIQAELLPYPVSHGRRSKAVDADHWPRSTFFHKGFITSPQSSLQVMHKAEKRYEVLKVMEAEEAKQRQLKAILNKLTPQNFERLFQQVKEVKMDDAVTLVGLISQIFDKALMEPTFSEMYSNFCYHLAMELPDFVEDGERVTFKRLLLNKCQEEFERGEREQAEANRTDGDEEVRLSEAEREQKRICARRRMLGNIRLIGELYKKKMLTERIMHDCIKKLLADNQYPEEEDIEALCKLMSTIGEIIDHPKAKDEINEYFQVIASLSNNSNLSSRIRFMLKDAIDLRTNKWQQRRKIEGPKKIEELHSDAAEERRMRLSRLTFPNAISSKRRATTDFGSRTSTSSSPQNDEKDTFRLVPSQVRRFSSQDARLKDKHAYKHGSLSIPFPHWGISDNIVDHGHRGGFARGMSVRGSKVLYGSPLTNPHTSFGETRKGPVYLSGCSSKSERRPYSPKQ